MEQVLRACGALLMLLGALVMFISAVGLVRLPDIICRSHAMAKGTTLGIVLVLLGYWVFLGMDTATVKIFAAIAFQFFTIPIAGHLVGLMAWKESSGGKVSQPY